MIELEAKDAGELELRLYEMAIQLAMKNPLYMLQQMALKIPYNCKPEQKQLIIDFYDEMIKYMEGEDGKIMD